MIYSGKSPEEKWSGEVGMSYHNIKMLHAALDHPAAYAKHVELIDKRSTYAGLHEIYIWHPCDILVMFLVAWPSG